LPNGQTWDGLAALTPEQIRERNLLPAGFLPLPHVKQPAGGQVFPDQQIDEIQKDEGRNLRRFDVDFDLRSVEDFRQFEQRTAYFNGYHVSATRKGTNLPDRTNQVAMMAQMQNIIDFPPAPKLDPTGKLDPSKATQQELEGERVFMGKVVAPSVTFHSSRFWIIRCTTCISNASMSRAAPSTIS
jgi:hypothetical protein